MLRRLLRIALAAAVAAMTGLAVAATTGQAATAPGWRIAATLTDSADLSALSASGPAGAWTAGTACGGSLGVILKDGL